MSEVKVVQLVEACRNLARAWDAFQDYPNAENSAEFTASARALQDCLVRSGWAAPSPNKPASQSGETGTVIPFDGRHRAGGDGSCPSK
jgi:hypothetical protein